MFVEISVVVAVLAREPDAGEFVSKIERTATALTAGHVLLEASMRLSAMLGVSPLEAEAAIHSMLAEADIEIVPITREIAHEAVVAFDRFGKGRGHEAQLNFGDCLSYACARHHNVPLLFKGTDFIATDIARA
jgi:ribonuclease VapC